MIVGQLLTHVIELIIGLKKKLATCNFPHYVVNVGDPGVLFAAVSLEVFDICVSCFLDLGLSAIFYNLIKVFVLSIDRLCDFRLQQ